jgi:hypothetical protein
LGLQFSTVRPRLQEFYQPAQAKSDRDHCRQVEVTTCFAPWLAWSAFSARDWQCCSAC